MSQTVSVLSESAAATEAEFEGQIKSLRETVAQSANDVRKAKLETTQHQINADRIQKELDNQKSVGQIQTMQVQESLQIKVREYNDLKGEFESLKLIIQDMNNTSIRQRERAETQANKHMIATSEKDAQISKLQQVVRDYAAKSKEETVILQSTLEQSKSETLAARQQIEQLT